MLTAAARKKITRDWQGRLPQLGTVGPMLLGRIVGPFVQGILLDRRSDGKSYYPSIFVTSLTSSLTVFHMTVNQSLRTTRTHAVDSVSVISHEQRYGDAVDRLIAATLLPLNGDWRLRDVISTLLDSRDSGSGLGPRPGLMLELIGACVWGGAHGVARNLGIGLVDIVQSWPSRQKELHGGEKEWRERVEMTLESADTIHAYVADQMVRWRMERLPVSRLLID